MITNAHQRQQAQFVPFLSLISFSSDWSWFFYDQYIKQAGGNNETICALKDVDGDQSLPPVGDDDEDKIKKLSSSLCQRWMWRWTLETELESRFGAGMILATFGFTSTRCLASIGSPFQVGCQLYFIQLVTCLILLKMPIKVREAIIYRIS